MKCEQTPNTRPKSLPYRVHYMQRGPEIPTISSLDEQNKRYTAT